MNIMIGIAFLFITITTVTSIVTLKDIRNTEKESEAFLHDYRIWATRQCDLIVGENKSNLF